MAWNDTSDTCVAVYGTLITLREIDVHTLFDDAGAVLMKDMEFYDDNASPDVNKANALALARVVESTLYNSYADAYKAGYTRGKATTDIFSILNQTDKKIEDLSDTADLIYTIP